MSVGAVGLDFGSLRSVIAVAKKGGVEILANEGDYYIYNVKVLTEKQIMLLDMEQLKDS